MSITILSCMVCEGLTEKVSFWQRCKGWERERAMQISAGRMIQAKENTHLKKKIPKAEVWPVEKTYSRSPGIFFFKCVFSLAFWLFSVPIYLSSTHLPHIHSNPFSIQYSLSNHTDDFLQIQIKSHYSQDKNSLRALY